MEHGSTKAEEDRRRRTPATLVAVLVALVGIAIPGSTAGALEQSVAPLASVDVNGMDSPASFTMTVEETTVTDETVTAFTHASMIVLGDARILASEPPVALLDCPGNSLQAKKVGVRLRIGPFAGAGEIGATVVLRFDNGKEMTLETGMRAVASSTSPVTISMCRKI